MPTRPTNKEIMCFLKRQKQTPEFPITKNLIIKLFLKTMIGKEYCRQKSVRYQYSLTILIKGKKKPVAQPSCT
jgi:hypothetical protein